jgi:hypothetical protein
MKHVRSGYHYDTSQGAEEGIQSALLVSFGASRVSQHVSMRTPRFKLESRSSLMVRVPMGSPTSCCQIPEMVRACVSEPDSKRAVNAEESRQYDVAASHEE